MLLLPIEQIKVNQLKILNIDEKVKALYRKITFSRSLSSRKLLDVFTNSTNDLTEILSIKNAQMEAQNEMELEVYHKNLERTIIYILNEIKNNRPFNKQIQLFQLFKLLSPESYLYHPNRYRDTLVIVGNYICPEPNKIQSIVSQLFYNINKIENSIIKAIYFHHELVRIHPFIDGNGRVARIAKNWILMYNLYPPIFIKDKVEKKEYIDTLSQSFRSLNNTQPVWNEDVSVFFEQELNRILYSLNKIHTVISESKVQ